MAVTYGFYNSIGGDRKYDAIQMSAVFDGIIKDGVFDSIGEIFKVTPGTGLQVVVGSGRAWFNHTWTLNDAKLPLMIEAPDVTLKRYDAVVLEVNAAQATRANSIKVVTGTPGTEPSKPAMTNTEEVHQHALAYVLVEPGVQSIAESKIENVVGKSETPFVTAILETVSIDSLFTQWNGQFNDWFENVQSQLEGDVVTNLQRQIDLKLPKTVNTELVPNQIAYPNGGEKFAQLAFPTEAGSVLAQGTSGAPYWAKKSQMQKFLGQSPILLRKLSDVRLVSGSVPSLVVDFSLFPGYRYYMLRFDVYPERNDVCIYLSLPDETDDEAFAYCTLASSRSSTGSSVQIAHPAGGGGTLDGTPVYAGCVEIGFSYVPQIESSRVYELINGYAKAFTDYGFNPSGDLYTAFHGERYTPGSTPYGNKIMLDIANSDPLTLKKIELLGVPYL